MSRVYYVMEYRPMLPYLVLVYESVVEDWIAGNWIANQEKNADLRGEKAIVLENLPTVYLKEKFIGNSSIYEFVDNNVSGEAWLK